MISVRNLDRTFLSALSVLLPILVTPGPLHADEIPFGSQQIISTADGRGIDVIAGDLDGDGDLDLVASGGTNSPSGVYWFENIDGAGSFADSRVIDDDSGGLSNRVSIELADMDGDGDLDLLSGWFFLGAWYPNDGQGNFGARTVVRDETFSGSGYVDFQAADFDGDGDLDVAGLAGDFQSGNKLVWFENGGGGSFNPATENAIDAPLANANGAGNVRPADLDGDGDMDLVVTYDSAQVAWYRNTDGAGTFAARQEIATTQLNVGDIEVVDIDSDGDLDIVSVDYSFNSARWHENVAGDGTSWTDHDIATTNSASFHVSIADMDLDGDPDVLLGIRTTNEARWIENTAGDGSAWTNRLLSGEVSWPLATIAADLDGDGDPDAVTASLSDDKFAWNENKTIHRNAAFDQTQEVIGTGVDGATWVYPIDLDGDGDMDAVSTSENDNTLRWFESDGNNPPGWTPRTISATATGAWVSWADDVDGDGDVDALAASFTGNKIAWYENDGLTPPGWTERVIDATVGLATSVRTVDLDQDGDLDVIATGQTGNLVRWYENDGASPPLWTPRDISTGLAAARSADAADLDGDGDLDVMAAGFSTSNLLWFENDGATPPVWTQRTLASGLSAPNYIQAIDVDGDGDVDAVSAEVFGETLRWHESDGNSPPNFTSRTIAVIPGTNSLWTGYAIDMDQDGDADMIGAASSVGGGVVWFENSGGSPPSWQGRTVFNEPDTPRGVFAADMDGDGDPDVLGAGNSQDKISWYENRGGQYEFSGADAGDGTAPEGEVTSVLAATMRINGRPGDSVGRFGSMDLLFEDAGSTPLNDLQANALIENLHVYRDTGSGEFEEDSDILVQTFNALSLSAGVETIGLPAGDPNVLVAAPATFFVVAELTADASSQSPSSFTVTHLSDSGSIAFDASAGVEISTDFSPDFQSQTIDSVGGFSVDSTVDAVDANPGDGTCDAGGGSCTLRAAVQEANALAGDNHIFLPAGTYTLSIAGAGEHLSATGDLDITNIADRTTISGAGVGVTVIDAAGLDGVLDIRNSDVKLEDLTLTGGSEGAILITSGSPTVEIEDAELTGNSSSQSGGGVSHLSGTLILTRTSLTDNSVAATRVGGGLSTTSTVIMTGCTIRGNSATDGGGIHSSGTVTITNSTISGNTATSAGGGIWLSDGPGAPDLTLEAVTISGNDASVSGGIENSGATVNIRNTIIAGNTAGLSPDCQATLNSLGHNLIEDTTSCTINGVTTGNITGVAAQLVALGDNGGPTLTHALTPGSPAIDAGSCGGLVADQRGDPRPTGVPGTPDVDDGCDIGALETRSGPTQPRIEVPVRWCGLRGAPSIEDPTQVGETSVNDVLRKRHERSSDSIYTPLANIGFRSAGNVTAEDYPLIEDPDCVEGPPAVFTCDTGQRGDVFIDIEEANFEEFQQIVASCRSAWEGLDPDLQGVTAVHINRFVDSDGSPIEILGVGGRAGKSFEGEQAMAGRVMVVDNVYRLDVPANPDVPNPPDPIDRLLSHELGHALSLQHGDGVDNDSDGELDNDDDKIGGLPRFDGPNLMQYRNGTELTVAQIEQARNHMDDTLPDVDVQPSQDSVAVDAEIEPERRKILQFGYDGLTEIENARILQFANDSVLEFERRKILQFEQRKILQFERRKILQFENSRLLQFGMDYSGSLPADKTRLRASTGSIPWPAAIRPTTRYFYYLDLDRNDATGAYPPHKANPELPGTNFPGKSNFVDEADRTSESGVDLITQVELTSSCPGELCSSSAELKVFDYNDGSGVYELVHTEANPDMAALGVELYLDNGGQSIEDDNIATELIVQPEIDNSILFAAGWGFATPGGGGAPVPQRVRMEVVSTIDCEGNVLNDDPSSAAVDCQCTDCADCPDYPGCSGSTGTPKTISGTTILADGKAGELTFEPPLLPSCVSIPQLAVEGAALTVAVTDLPDDVSGTVEVVVDATVVGTQAIAPVDGGSVDVAVLLPASVTGPVRLSTGIVGLAPRADCIIDVTPSLACDDNDGDGDCDSTDTDDDNDGVTDGSDSHAFNPFLCGDGDVDGCDDCASGSFAPFQDGADYDLDGLCDAGDPDDDNDGVPDGLDGEPRNEFACGDTEGDSCDDCVNGFPADPADDGPDFDLDGLCDFGDPDDDNDGTIDAADCAPNDATVERIPDGFAGLTFEADKIRVSWSALHADFGSATTVDLVRGELAMLPVGSGAESCLLEGSTDTFYDDATPVSAGTGLWYLLRGENACGTGDFGETSDGGPRFPAACP